jgi:integrase
MIADVLALYGEEVAPQRKTARNISYNITNLLKWWGDKTTAAINQKACKAYAATKAEQGAGGDLKVLKAAILYWDGNEDYGPLDRMPKFWRPEDNPPKDRWLTRDEAARLVRAAKPYQHLRRMILLGLYTGSRPGVILAMQWDQIDFRSGVMLRTPVGARQDKKKRAPSVKLGRRILGHLRRWKKIDNGARYVCHFTGANHVTGKPVDDPHGAWAKVIRTAGLEGVTRHTLRHTRATWMAQAGVSLFEAAGFLGMTVKTLERVYAHHDPRHQENAANI